MTFNQFTVFAAAAKHLNLTKAAQALHTSQPTVSKQLKLLEDTYKVKLFTRNATGIELTDDGRSFLRYMTPVLTHLDRLNQRFQASRIDVMSGSLTVGGSYGSAAILIPSALAAFKLSHPDVQVRLIAASSGSLGNQVSRGRLEIAVVNFVPPLPNLAYQFYRTDNLVAFAVPDHPLAKKKALKLSEVTEIPLIVRGGRSVMTKSDGVLKQLRALGFKPVIGMRCNSPEGVKTAVRNKLGIGILYHDMVRSELTSGQFTRVHIPGVNWEGKTFIIHHKKRSLSPNAHAFLKLLGEWRREQ
ncbi:MAG: LysR family transcriptional regulator [Deltaproteobacteria bacterium]|nr:LysR family transcriptional regulator [Deltaproteobacteria bacterium]